MTFQETIESGLKQMETMLGSKEFTYDGEVFKCHVGTQTVSSVLETGGFDETQTIVLVVRKSVFDDGIYPQDNEKIIYNEVTYYVDVVNFDATDSFLNIVLKKTK